MVKTDETEFAQEETDQEGLLDKEMDFISFNQTCPQFGYIPVLVNTKRTLTSYSFNFDTRDRYTIGRLRLKSPIIGSRR